MLDPAQNHTFRDHYLEVDLDLSDVLFLATANVLDTIPGPLLDRLEIIRLDGYTEDEKVAIARDHLLARQVERNGLRPDEVDGHRRRAARASSPATPGRPASASSSASSARLLRKVAVAGRRRRRPTPDHRRRRRRAPTLLGRARFHAEEIAERTVGARRGHRPGRHRRRRRRAVRRGDRRWTASRASRVTGQLGDVMKESAQIALSYVRAHADELGIDAGRRSAAGSTCTSPPGRCPRTARRPASP